MAWLSFVTGAWVISAGMSAYKTDTFFIDPFVFSFGVLIMTSLLHLALIFPYRFLVFDRLHCILLYTPATFISLAAFFSKSLSNGSIASSSYAGEVVAGPLYQVYNVFLTLLFFLSLGIFIYRYYRTSGLHRVLVGRLVFGVIVGGIPAVVIDLLWSIFSTGVRPNFLYGSILTLFWLGIISYSVLKK